MELLLTVIFVASFVLGILTYIFIKNKIDGKKLDDYIEVMRECSEKKAEAEMVQYRYPHLSPVEQFKMITEIYYPTKNINGDSQ